MRIDFVLYMGGQPGQSFSVTDTFYRNRAYRLLGHAQCRIIEALSPDQTEVPRAS